MLDMIQNFATFDILNTIPNLKKILFDSPTLCTKSFGLAGKL